MGILVNLDKVKIHLDDVDETDQDALLNQLIDQVDEVIANELSRDRVPGKHPISSEAGTEFYSGNDYEELLLRRRPVTVISRVAVDSTGYFGKGTDAFAVSTDWIEGTDFVSKSLDATEGNPGILLSLITQGFGGLASMKGAWPEGRGNILVTYTAGYTTIPKDLEYAAIQLVAAAWNSSDVALGGPVDSTRLGDQAFQLLKSDLGPTMLHVRNVLSRYKEV